MSVHVTKTTAVAAAIALLAGCLLAGSADPAGAVDRTDRWGLGVDGGLMTLTGGARDYSNFDWYGAFNLSRGLSPAWNLQLALRTGRTRAGVSNPGESAGWTTGAGAPFFTPQFQSTIRIQRRFRTESSFTPYLGADAGLVSWKVKSVDVPLPVGDAVEGYDKDGNRVELKDTRLTLGLELGAEYALGRDWALNAGARLHFMPGTKKDNVGLSAVWGPDHVDANTSVADAYLGVTWWLGSDDDDGDGILDVRDACPDHAEDVDGHEDDDGCPDPDNDGDGIPDDQDACPDDSEDRDGYADDDGCPDPDNDGDGILDADDGCPDEAEDMDGFMDEDGCPDPDNDGDGVLDADDQCPGTAAGLAVDDTGCALALPAPPPAILPVPGQTLVLETVSFSSGSARLLAESAAELDALARALLDYPDAMIEVRGHTDSLGLATSNKDLSMRRALAVRDALIQRGVAPARIETLGYGDEVPRANNETAEGRALNRRVEVHRLQ